MSLRVEQVLPPMPAVAGITLALAIPKGNNMDLIVQKAVELGASRIIPLITERTIVRLNAKEAAAKCSGTGIDRNFCNIPTNGVKNARVLLGNVPHWLSVTPTAEMPEIEWVCAEQLLPD